MKKRLFIVLLLFCVSFSFAQNSYDLVIVGGNPGGIMAAISAARMGKSSVILERTSHIGGLPANGLNVQRRLPFRAFGCSKSVRCYAGAIQR